MQYPGLDLQEKIQWQEAFIKGSASREIRASGKKIQDFIKKY